MSDAPPPYAVSAGNAAPPPGLYPQMPHPGGAPPPVNPQYMPGYGQPPPQHVMMQPPVAQVIVTAGYGPHSMSTVCNNCRQQVSLSVSSFSPSHLSLAASLVIRGSCFTHPILIAPISISMTHR